MMPRKTNTLVSEAGVFGVLFALFALTIISMLLMTVDTMKARAAKANAQFIAEELCKRSVQHLPLSLDAVLTAREQLETLELENGYSRLRRLRIVTPTTLTSYSNPIPYVAGPPGMMPILGPSSCGVDLTCEFAGDIRPLTLAPGVMGASYPRNFWDVTDFNGYLGCEAEVQYDTSIDFLGLGLQRRAIGKTAYKTEVRGSRVGPNGARDGGVFFGIAPYIEVYPWEQRFRFSSPTFSAIDPLTNIDHGSIPQTGNLAFTLDRESFDPGIYGQSFAQTDAIRSDRRFNPGEDIMVQWSAAGAPGNVRYSSRDEFLLQKYNLVFAARNKVLAGLAELFSRHRNTRRSSVSIISPRNADNSPNPPVFLNAPGEDMLTRQYEFPYLNYVHQSVMLGAPLGRLCPFDGLGIGAVGTSGLACPNAGFHLLTASTLRDAWFVFNQSNGSQSLGMPWANNGYLEPGTHRSDAHVRLDYPSPAAPHDAYWGPSDENHRVSVPELLRILPGSETCPIHYSDGTKRCLKEAVAPYGAGASPNGQVGDLNTFLQTALGNSQALRTLIPPARNPHIPDNNGFAPPTYANPDQDSLVILFSHKPLQGSGDPAPLPGQSCSDVSATPSPEMQTIRTSVDTLNAQGRSVIVIYMPVNNIGMDKRMLCDYRVAFNAEQDPLSGRSVTGNYVFRIGPTDTTEETTCGTPYVPNASGTPEDLCFQSFFESFLGDGPVSANAFVRTLASVIFEERLAL